MIDKNKLKQGLTDIEIDCCNCEHYKENTNKNIPLKNICNIPFKYGNSCKFTIKDETLDEIIENSQILK